MNTNDRVTLTQDALTWAGRVTSRSDNGMCTVEWDSGVTERVHENELALEASEPEKRSFRSRLVSWITGE